MWNIAGIAASNGEVILTEALIDALTFWCAGFRNVTACYGVEGLTEDHLAGFGWRGIRRALIAFDRDEAGERGAAKVAERLMAAGIACFRIQFPKGMDANDYALKVTPAAKSLGALIRKAAWLGQGADPRGAEPPMTIEEAENSAPSPLAAEAAGPTDAADAVGEIAAPAESLPSGSDPQEIASKERDRDPELVEGLLPASPLPQAPRDAPAEISEQEIVLRFADRRWRVRGLPKNLAVGVLKVNLMVASGVAEDGAAQNKIYGAPSAFHVDTFDLYAARAREHFLARAAAELRLGQETLKSELGRVLLKLEQLQDEAVAKALEPAAPCGPGMSDAERDAALDLLRAPDLMARVLADFEACGVVGEATNKLVGYLAATSRKLDRPLAVVIQSSSAAGKSALMDAVLAFMPEEETVRYSAMTGQSLFYMSENNLKHRILAIAEEQGAARASYALKLLQSEGELTIASTGTDAAGNMVTQEYRVEGPVMLFMTTTAIDVDEELMNRCLVLSVDEGREQTRAIHARQRARRTLDGLLAKAAKEELVALHRDAQRLLRPLAVVNPYADRLSFLDDRTRTRRDHEKYLSLIDAIAFLHQHQRPVKTVILGERRLEYIEATLDDIDAANALAHEVLGRSLDELPPQTRRVLASVQVLVRERAETQRLAAGEVRFTRKDLRDRTGAGDTQLKVHLARLAELGYLLAHRSERGFEYELLYDGEGADTPYLSGLIDANKLGTRHYDDERSGANGMQSAPGRGVVGGVSGPGRTAHSVIIQSNSRACADQADLVPETRAKGYAERRNGNAASYVQAGRMQAAQAGR